MKKVLALVVVLILVAVPFLGLAEIDPTADTMLHTMQKLVRKAKNITLAASYDIEFDLGGTKVPYKSSEVSVIFQDPLIIYTRGLNAEGQTTEVYGVQQGKEIVVYASHISEDHMISSEPIAAEDLETETMGEIDAITNLLDDMVSAQILGDETVTVNGKDYSCVRIAVTAGVDSMVEEMVHNTLLATPNSDHAWSDAIEVTLHKLTVPLEYWIDKESGMLVQYTTDLQDLMEGIHTFIPNEVDGGFVFTKYTAVVQVLGVNDAEEIMIPAKYIAYNEH